MSPPLVISYAVSTVLVILLGYRTWPWGAVWSISGTAVAAAAWDALILGSGYVRVARMGKLDVLSVAGDWLVAILTGGFIYVLPSFLACFAIYRRFGETILLRGRVRAGLYSATWHLFAHAIVVIAFERGINGRPITARSYLLLPALIGFVWGLWLPSLRTRSVAADPSA